MPLRDPEATKRIELSTPGEYIDIFTGVSAKRFRKALAEKYDGDGSEEIPVYLAVVKGWNLKDAGGNDLPVTADNLALLTVQDDSLLITAVKDIYLPKA